MQPRKRGSRALALVALSLTLALSGCGDDKPKPTGTAAQLVQAGLLALNQNDQDAAFSAFTAASKKDPKNHFAHYNLGYIYQQRGDNARALEEYQLALAISPDFVPALYNSGTIYGASDAVHAMSIYRRVVKLDPHNAAAYLNLGLLEAENGDKKQGRVDLEKAISLDGSLATRIPTALFPELAPASPRPSATATK